MERTYIAIDLKSFYASVECVERGLDPLTAKLVVADEERTSKTICLAVSPALKALGISGRARLFEVEQKAAEIKATTGKDLEYIVACPRMSFYMRYSAEIYALYLKYISPDDIQVYSIDEVFIDATSYLKFYGMTAKQLAMKLIREVLDTTGITATAGIGSNLYLCKVAMDIVAKHMPADENGVRMAELNEMSYRKLLWNHLPLTDFWRIGGGTARKLAQNGFHTMGDIARLSIDNEDWLYRIFGIDAEILIDHAWGIEPCTIADIKAHQPKTSSYSNGQVLSCPYTFEKARIVTLEMSDQLCLQLTQNQAAASSFTLHIGFDRENVDSGLYKGEVKRDWYGRAVPVPAHGTANFGDPTNSSTKINDEVMRLYDRIVNKKLTIRRIYLTANGVEPQSFYQYDLFSAPEAMDKEHKLQEAMVELQTRFGKNAVFKAASLEKGATLIERNNQIGGHRAGYDDRSPLEKQ